MHFTLLLVNSRDYGYSALGRESVWRETSQWRDVEKGGPRCSTCTGVCTRPVGAGRETRGSLIAEARQAESAWGEGRGRREDNRSRGSWAFLPGPVLWLNCNTIAVAGEAEILCSSCICPRLSFHPLAGPAGGLPPCSVHSHLPAVRTPTVTRPPVSGPTQLRVCKGMPAAAGESLQSSPACRSLQLPSCLTPGWHSTVLQPPGRHWAALPLETAAQLFLGPSSQAGEGVC